MSVENFWHQLKHDYLHHVAWPRLDQLVWILIDKVTPAYIAHAEMMNDNYCLGRPKQLTTYQKYFKSSWKKLSERTLSDKEYNVNIEEWTCTCGQQKYNCHHICKHLVQSVNPPEKCFWREVVCRRVLPIYRHPALVAKGLINETSPAYIEPDGTISDGDDHIWSGDCNILKGGGGWQKTFDAVEMNKVLGKRKQEDSQKQEMPPTVKTMTQTGLDLDLVETIDLTMSSSPAPEEDSMIVEDEPFCTSSNVVSGSSSPVEYGSEDEEEVSCYYFFIKFTMTNMVFLTSLINIRAIF